MPTKPFLKWAGGKRWLESRPEFSIPDYSGRYVEPFLGGAAVFFFHEPSSAILADTNSRLIDAYNAIKNNWKAVQQELERHQELHSIEHYYSERKKYYGDICCRAAQFLYLNRACWNGLYRENLKGSFNVPIGTKNNIMLDTDNFEYISERLQGATIACQDFEHTVDLTVEGDFVFADPPYTTAHNMNGFVKYNQKIFTWADQIRLRDSVVKAHKRGVRILITNANHPSVRGLYDKHATVREIHRSSVISGKNSGRAMTSEALFCLG
ncbi:Dam family site-specific DNA-(adenine-N6)-methyltransferase [Mesorhizobium sp. M0938]|uniref:DNA adenine methylase n=1 Tax=unclassified Mesorhizobium TaxID=325217 RepID=UPI003336E1A4